MATRIIHVHADWAGLGGPVPLGELRVDVVRGRETYAFTYADGWLRNGARVSLDPGLQLFSGPQYPAADREAFGMFLDSAPDRWGRTKPLRAGSTHWAAKATPRPPPPTAPPAGPVPAPRAR